MDILHNIIDSTNGFLYTYWLVFALIACGLYLSIRTRFIQLRFLKDAFMVLNERSHQKHISPFGALMISTASRVGIGNSVGVSIAIVSGGVGALFWMWVTALVGGASAFIESTLAQVYKRKDGEHRYKGGPAYYIETALHSRALGIIFAISLILCFTYGFNGLQSYTLTSAFEIFVGNEVFNDGGGLYCFCWSYPGCSCIILFLWWWQKFCNHFISACPYYGFWLSCSGTYRYWYESRKNTYDF